MVERTDPAEVEHMISIDSLDFVAEDRSQSLTLVTIEFDSEGAANDYVELMTSQIPDMQAHSAKIGDASFYAAVNESAFGSMVLFKKGLWVVTLHTAQPNGTSPLVDLSGLEAMARIVANRL